MKIAVLSDIHGNFTAFRAVLNELNELGIDEYIIAGDHTGDCPQSNEVLEKVKELKAYVIKGNREEYVLTYHKGTCDEWKRHKQMSSVVWTHDAMNEGNMKYIDELPEQLSVSFPQMDTIRVVHGSPFSSREELFKDKYPERLERALSSIEESVLICGHTHRPWHKVLCNKLILNPGSIGVHFNENKCAEYAILIWENGKWKVTHHQVKYDLKELEDKFYESGLIEISRAWSRLTLQGIKEGKNTVVPFIKYAYELAEKDGFIKPKLIPNSVWDKAEELWFNGQ